MRIRHALGAAVAGALLVLAPAPPASAVEGTIGYVEGTDEGLQILVSVPPDADIDLDAVQVTLDGQATEAAARPAGTDTRIRRTTILAIDTSNSMEGDRFQAAKDAALAFVDSVPEDVFVGIVSFDAEVTDALAPTTDRDQARAVIASLSLSPQTRLYDGLLSAMDLAGSQGQRLIMVLSDGADTSTTPIASVTSAIEETGTFVDVVALEQRPDKLDPLEQIAAAGGGELVEADREALTAAFAKEARILSSQVLVTAQIPAGVTDSKARIRVTLPSSAGDITASAYSIVQHEQTTGAPGVALPKPPELGWTAPDWLMYAGVGAVAIGLLVALLMLVPGEPVPLTVAERIGTYAVASGTGPARVADEPDAALLATAKQAVAGVLERNRGLDARIAHRLEGAGSELKSSEWLLLHAAIFVGSGVLGLVIGQGDLIVGLLLLLFGAVAPWVYLAIRRSRRRKAFNAALPDTLQLISGSLAAGLSLSQSIDTVVREGREPVASEFRRVLVETRLGVSLEDALDGVTVRFESKDFEWVVMAIRIQRQVGGNLAELLDSVAATMREREYLRRQVSALSAEGRLSAAVLSGLPPVFMLYLLLTQRDYVMVLFTDTRGLIMIVGAALWLSLGVFWMSKLVKVEV